MHHENHHHKFHILYSYTILEYIIRVMDFIMHFKVKYLKIIKRFKLLLQV